MSQASGPQNLRILTSGPSTISVYGHKAHGQWPSLSGLSQKASHTLVGLGTLGKAASQHFPAGTGGSCVLLIPHPHQTPPPPAGAGRGSLQSLSPAPRNRFPESSTRHFLGIFPGTSLCTPSSPPPTVPVETDILEMEEELGVKIHLPI